MSQEPSPPFKIGNENKRKTAPEFQYHSCAHARSFYHKWCYSERSAISGFCLSLFCGYSCLRNSILVLRYWVEQLWTESRYFITQTEEAGDNEEEDLLPHFLRCNVEQDKGFPSSVWPDRSLASEDSRFGLRNSYWRSEREEQVKAGSCWQSRGFLTAQRRG